MGNCQGEAFTDGVISEQRFGERERERDMWGRKGSSTGKALRQEQACHVEGWLEQREQGAAWWRVSEMAEAGFVGPCRPT